MPGLLPVMAGNQAANATCNYQAMTGSSRLYKDIPDPKERRLDDPRVCHPGTGCTARKRKKTQAEKGEEV